MTRDGGVPVERSWIHKKFRSDVPPGQRALAIALQNLCRHITPTASNKSPDITPTQADAARHLLCSESSLSRFLSGQSVPRFQSVEHFYKTACADAGGEHALGVTLDDLRKLHKAASDERCQSCVDLRSKLTAAASQAVTAEAELAALRQSAFGDAAELASLRREVKSLKEAVSELRATRAGLQARLTTQAALAPLPVPRRRGDRQRNKNEVSAARQVAKRAAELRSDGRQDAALTLLRHTTEVLSPVETAALFRALRQQQQNELVDNLIHIYGRDHRDQEVMHVTWELHKQGSPDDAGALLRAAIE
jgi:transcriptional regulator with XRE-family HTH domain